MLGILLVPVLVVIFLETFASHESGEVDHTSRETGLVIVPRNHLNEVSVDDVGQFSIDRGAVFAAVGVDRDEFSRRGTEDSL